MAFTRITTDDVPPAQRRRYVEDNYAAMARFSIDFDKRHPVFFNMAMRDLPGLRIAHTSISPFSSRGRARRESAMEDPVFLGITTRGVGRFIQNGMESELPRLSGRLCEFDRDYTSAMTKAGSTLGIVLSRKVLEARMRDVDALFRHTLAPALPQRLLFSYAKTLLGETSEVPRDQERAFATHLTDVVVLALGAARPDEIELAEMRGGRAARLHALKADIAAHLGNSELSLEWLAGRHHMSARTIRDLFYAGNTSFTDYVRNARLERAHALLCDPDRFSQTITSIAYECGFGDLSWFNQVFRRHFGVTPSDLRKGERG